jgi:hypothetical protein
MLDNVNIFKKFLLLNVEVSSALFIFSSSIYKLMNYWYLLIA